MSAAALEIQNVTWAPRRRAPLIVQDTSFALGIGRVLGVVGPNGAGKSSLLRLLYRYHKPLSGRVLVGGADIWSLTPKAAARKIAAVLQEPATDFGLTVQDVVSLGRIPHREGIATSGARDARIISATLQRLNLTDFTQRTLGSLSGGERQRVMVARAMVQEPEVLILDEPTNHMDIRHQLEVLALIRDLDLTIVISLHDLNLAASVCDDLLLLDGGRIMAFGTPQEVLTPERLARAFQVSVRRDRLVQADRDHLTFHLFDTEDH